MPQMRFVLAVTVVLSGGWGGCVESDNVHDGGIDASSATDALAPDAPLTIGGGDAQDDGGSDGRSWRDAQVPDSPFEMDGLSPMCCPIDEFPTCDCRSTGGTRLPNGRCPGICDAVPIVVRRYVDNNGCPAIELSERSCLDRRDSATDN